MYQKAIHIIVRLTRVLRRRIDSLLFQYYKNKNDYTILNKFHNRECLIVGNGPSLNRTDLARISMPSIAMNKINLLFESTDWRPDCIVCVNGLVIRQNRSFFNETDIPLVLTINSLYLGIKKRPNIIYVYGSDDLVFQSDITKPIGVGSTVSFICLQLAAFVKARAINIVGVDHNFTMKGQSNEIQLLEGSDPNHFHPKYFENMLWGLPDLKGSEDSYKLAKEYFESQNIRVVDYTVDGKLNIFVKGDIQNLYA